MKREYKTRIIRTQRGIRGITHLYIAPFECKTTRRMLEKVVPYVALNWNKNRSKWQISTKHFPREVEIKLYRAKTEFVEGLLEAIEIGRCWLRKALEYKETQR